MTPQELITTSLKYFDGLQENIKNYTKKFKYIKVTHAKNDLEYNKMHFYDENKKLVIESDYEILGIYFIKPGLWVWSWAVPTNYFNLANTSRKILNYGLDMVPNIEDLLIRSELITSRFRITNSIQLDIHLALAVYLSKIPFLMQLNYPLIPTEDPDMVELSPEGTHIYYLCLLNENIKKL